MKKAKIQRMAQALLSSNRPPWTRQQMILARRMAHADCSVREIHEAIGGNTWLATTRARLKRLQIRCPPANRLENGHDVVFPGDDKIDFSDYRPGRGMQ